MKGLDTLAAKLINQAPKEIGKIAEARIRQVVNSGGPQIQKIAPQIIQGAIEDVYKTPFRLLGKLDKQKFSQLKRKLSKIFWEKWLMEQLQIKFIMVALHTSNGERKLVDFKKGESCICATANPFSKERNTFYPMQTREATKNRQLIKRPYRYVYKNLHWLAF